MPYARNSDINIYYEVEGEGPPLVLYHGFAGSLEDWREWGYVDSLKNDYQLILADARGHGKSGKPHDPSAYTMENRVSDVISILDILSIESTNFFGYSYGGRLTYELAISVPDRINSLIVGGTGARGQEADFLIDRIKPLETGPEAIVEAFERAGPLTRDMRTRLLANDCDALIAILKLPWPYREDNLPGINIPFLLLAGELDPRLPAIEEASKRLPDSTFVSLPGLNHMQTASRIDVVIPHIKEFLERILHT